MKKEEILVNCIDDIQAGRFSLEECITRYPELAGELREYSRILRGITRESVAPTVEFKGRARAHLIKVMNTPEARRVPALVWLQSLMLRRVGYAFSIASLVLAGSGATVYASQNTLPQDTLYPVKTVVENVQVALTVSPEAKTKLHMKLAERRINEVVSEAAEGRIVSTSALEAAVNQMEDVIEGINNMPEGMSNNLLVQLSQSTFKQQAELEQISQNAPDSAQPALKKAIDATRRGNLIANVASDNPALLNTGASVHDEKLESTYFELEGTLLSVEGRTWTVGNIKLERVNAPKGTPRIGSDVKLNGIVRSDEIFIGKIEWQDKALEGTRIGGIFSGTNVEGTVWNVGGIPVGEFHDEVPPALDKQVEVKGTGDKRTYSIVESKQWDESKTKTASTSKSQESKSRKSDSNKSNESNSKTSGTTDSEGKPNTSNTTRSYDSKSNTSDKD